MFLAGGGRAPGPGTQPAINRSRATPAGANRRRAAGGRKPDDDASTGTPTPSSFQPHPRLPSRAFTDAGCTNAAGAGMRGADVEVAGFSSAAQPRPDGAGRPGHWFGRTLRGGGEGSWKREMVARRPGAGGRHARLRPGQVLGEGHRGRPRFNIRIFDGVSEPQSLDPRCERFHRQQSTERILRDTDWEVYGMDILTSSTAASYERFHYVEATSPQQGGSSTSRNATWCCRSWPSHPRPRAQPRTCSATEANLAVVRQCVRYRSA